jgi:hypothetical protein
MVQVRVSSETDNWIDPTVDRIDPVGKTVSFFTLTGYYPELMGGTYKVLVQNPS